MNSKKTLNLIRKPEVLAIVSFRKSTLYNQIKEGLFVPPVSIGSRAVAWVESEVQAVVKAMIAEQSQDQIKALVIQLIEQRKSAA